MKKSDHFLFFADTITTSEITLDAAEVRHAVAVLRSQNGDVLHVTDGAGGYATGVLDMKSDRNARLIVTTREFKERDAPFITLAIGMPERDAFESVLADATALGVYRIIPVCMHYCQKRWWESGWDKHLLRFRQIMITALKQSQGLFLPQLSAPATLESVLAEKSGLMIVADPGGGSLASVLSQAVNSQQPIICFIGPPGGFYEKEQLLFEQYGVASVRIAPLRLRTELAATTLCAQIVGSAL